MPYPIATILAGAACAYLLATLCGAALARWGFPLPPAGRRLGCIDGLRGYLAISVLIHHFIIWIQVLRLGTGWTAPTMYVFNQFGAGAVALFFMTTGFVFYPRVLAGLRATSWPAVYVTRIFRIVPMTAASVVLIAAVVMLRTGHGPGHGDAAVVLKWLTTWGEPDLLGYPDTGRMNAYVLWSLWFEWLFYLFVLPVCAGLMDLLRGRAPSWMVPALLLLFGWKGQLLPIAYPAVVASLMPYLPLFAIGMLAFECQRRTWLAAVLARPAMGLVAGLALVFAAKWNQTPYSSSMPLYGIGFGCIACGNSLFGLLRTRGALVLGECSFGIYLVHGLVLSLIYTDAAGLTARMPTYALPALLIPAAIAVTFLTAGTHLAVERPFIRLGSRLARLWTGRRINPEAAQVEVAP